MNIDPKSIIAGIPALEARRVLKSLREAGFFTADIPGEKLGLTSLKSQTFHQTLVSLGLIEPVPELHTAAMFRTTARGNAIVQASATKAIKRQTADKRLSEFIERVDQINSDPYWLYSIPEVRLFGSMLTDTPTVNDVDLAFDLEPKQNSKQDFDKALYQRIDEALKQGRRFSNFLEEFSWPQTESYRHLKARARVISIHPLSEPERLGAEYQTVYRFSKDTRSV